MGSRECNALQAKTSHKGGTEERRDYFRIEDMAQIQCLPIDRSSALANICPTAFSQQENRGLIRELQEIDQDNALLLRSLGDTNRDLEQYLKSINRKLDLIAKCLVESTEAGCGQQTQLVSISEGGLSFRSPVEYSEDSHLAVQLTLLPSQLSMVLFSRIINCSSSDNGPHSDFSIGVSFVNLRDRDRQIIAKHIIQLQMAERRVDNETPL